MTSQPVDVIGVGGDGGHKSCKPPGGYHRPPGTRDTPFARRQRRASTGGPCRDEAPSWRQAGPGLPEGIK